LRELFAYKPPITKDQFFAAGFGERKVIMCTQVLELVHNKHRSLVGITRSSSTKHRHNQTLPAALGASMQVWMSQYVIHSILTYNKTLKRDFLCETSRNRLCWSVPYRCFY